MVIDRECWGFVPALIANMESTALGSFLSASPCSFLFIVLPGLPSVLSFLLDIISFLWFALLSPPFLLATASKAFCFVFVCRTSWRPADKKRRGRGECKVYCIGFSIIEQLTGNRTRGNESAARDIPFKQEAPGTALWERTPWLLFSKPASSLPLCQTQIWGGNRVNRFGDQLE